MPPLSFQAPPPRRLAVRRHFKPNGPTALSPHSGSRAVSQFAALVERATMHSFAAHSLRRSPDGSLAAIPGMSPYHLAGSIVGPAAFLTAGVQHRAHELAAFPLSLTGHFSAVGH